METKKNPKVSLERYSSIFSLLGLVLSLFITLIFIEHKTYAAVIPTLKTIQTFTVDSPQMVHMVREEKKLPKMTKPEEIKELVDKPTKPKENIDPTKFKKADNDDIIIEKPIADSTEEDIPIEMTNIKSMGEDEAPVEETIPFLSVDNVPVFPGCEKYINHKAKSKKCFNKKMSKFFGKNFDLNVASDLNLYGIQKISCQFIINSDGEISPDIQTSKTHPELAKEIKDVIKKLPKMIPAKQNGKAVNLIYMLPVRFQLQ